MSCDCYKVGGPFISEDPNCAAHGTEARRAEKAREEESAAKDEKIAKLERRLAALEEWVEEYKKKRGQP